MSLSHHKDDDVTGIVDHFASCLFLVFSYFFFEVEFKKDKVFIENFIKEPGPDTIREISIPAFVFSALRLKMGSSILQKRKAEYGGK